MTANKRRILIIVFTILFILAGIGAFIAPLAKINSSALEGSGTESSPYRISSVADLKAFRDSVNGGNAYAGQYVQLTNDIDMKYATFTPIGSVSTAPFKGHFDGNNHTINGLLVQQSGVTSVNNNSGGLFGHVSGATIKNLKIVDENVYVTSAGGAAGKAGANNKNGGAGGSAVSVYAGGLVADAAGSTISNCQISGVVYAAGGGGGAGGTAGAATATHNGYTGGAGGNGGSAYSGGLVALADGCVISDCSFVGSIFGQSGSGGSGGAGNVAKTSGTGGVGGAGGAAGTAMVGGLVARQYNNTSNADTTTAGSITGSYTNAYVRAFGGNGGYGGGGSSGVDYKRGGQGGNAKTRSTIYVGGLVAESGGTISNSFAVGKIDMRASYKGMPGNGGYGSTSSSSAGTNKGAIGTVPGDNPYSAAGGIVGYVIGSPSITSVYSDVDITESHAFNYYTDYNTRLGGIAGLIGTAVEITNAVSLNLHYEAEKSAVGNAFSAFATFTTQAIANSVQGLADNIRYPNGLELINHNKGALIETDFTAMGERCAVIPSLGNLSMGGVFAGFDNEIWGINSSVNNGRPTLKKVAFKETEKFVYNVSTREELLELSNKISSGAPVIYATVNILDDFELGDWTPIGVSWARSVTFLEVNGNGHTLNKMRIDKTTDCKGFIGHAANLTIRDLTIEDPYITGAAGNYVGGIVGVVTTRGKIINCHVTQSNKPSGQNAVITGKCYVGGVVGNIFGFGRTGEILDCSSTVKVRCATGASTATSLWVGGLAGLVYNTNVERCYSTGDVVCDAYNTAITYYAAAFIAGMYWNSNVKNCFATGNLTTAIRGSFIAYVNETCSDGKVENCYYTGNVTYIYGGTNLVNTNGIYYGGIISLLQASNKNAKFTFRNNVALTKSFTLKNKTTVPEHRRFGNLYATAEPRLYATQNSTTKDVRVSYKYIQQNMIASNNYYRTGRTWTKSGNTQGTSPALWTYFVDTSTQSKAYDYYAQINADKRNFWVNSAQYDLETVWEWNEALGLPTLRDNAYSVPGMAGQAIEIATVEDLATFRDTVNAGYTYAAKTVKLVADLDLSGIMWTPIGKTSTVYFGGIFDGNGHTISNLYVNQAAANKGLFGTAANATIKNLKLKNPVIVSSAYDNTGALAGWINNCTISDCQVIGGSITSTANNVGGVIGAVSSAGAVIKGCSSIYDPDATLETNLRSPITGKANTGGILGNAAGSAANKITITECYSSRTINSTANYAGGITGLSVGANYSKCYSTGSIYTTAGLGVGGIVGRINTYAASISNCFSTGDMYSYSAADSSYAGGIVGVIGITACSINNCYVYGTISACTNIASKHSAAGGIVGMANVATTRIGGCAVLSNRVVASNYNVVNASAATYFAYSGIFGNGHLSGSTVQAPSVPSGKTNFYASNLLLGYSFKGNADARNSIRADKGNAVAKSRELFKTSGLYESQSAGLSWDFSEIWEWQEGVNNGYPYLQALGVPVYEYGSAFNTIKINDRNDYATFANNVNSGLCYDGRYIEQTADIDISGINKVGYDFAHSFSGNYDGGHYKLTNFSTTEAASQVGVFGYVKFASFKNVNVVKPQIVQTGASYSNVGGMIGASLTNLYVNYCAVLGGSVKADGGNVGGLVGLANFGHNIITNSFSTATVNAGKYAGGVVGLFRVGYVQKCYSRANVTATMGNGHSAGGIIGRGESYARVFDSYAIGNISDKSSSTYAIAGGIIGSVINAGNQVFRCYFNGTLSAQTTLKTASGNAATAYAAGIVGWNNTTTTQVKDCVNLATKITVTAASAFYYQSARIMSGYTNNKPASGNTSGNYTLATAVTRKNLNTQVNGNTVLSGATLDDGVETFKQNCTTYLPSWWYTNSVPRNVWTVNEDLNNGLPTLIGLPPDNSELDSLIDLARGYKASDWNVPTYTALMDAADAAEAASQAATLTDSEKAAHIKAINEAIENLRPDTTQLQALYDTIMTDIHPYKEWFVNYATMNSSIALAETVLGENSNKYKNADVNLTYSTLKMAYDNLIVNKFALNQAIIKANNVVEADYKPEDLENLNRVKLAAVAVNNNANATAREVCNATQALNDALAGLKVNKENLENIIKRAYEVLGGTITFNDGEVELDDTNKLPDAKFETMDAFNTTFTEAVSVYENDAALGTEVSRLTYELGVALNNLTLSKTLLKDLYNAAGLKQESRYEEESWAAFKEAFDAARVVLLEPAAEPDDFIDTSARIDEAYENLKDAIDNLKISKAQLEELIGVAEEERKNVNYYSSESLEALEIALTAAKDVYDDEDATSEQIDKAANDLNEAILNLTINVAYLKLKIAEADKLLADGVREYYTAESTSALETSRNNADQLVKDFEADESSVDIDSVKSVTKDLISKISGITADVAKLQKFISRTLDENDPDTLIGKGYAKESMDSLTVLANDAQSMLEGEYNNESVIKAIKDFEYAIANMKADKTDLIQLVREVSGWKNSKHRQDNDGNWIMDEVTGELKVFVVYSTETWDFLQAKLGNATTIVNKATASVEEVKTAYDELVGGIDNLLIDDGELSDRVEKARARLDRVVAIDDETSMHVFTAASRAALQIQYDKALIVLDKIADRAITIDEVQKMLDDLVEAIENLVVDPALIMQYIAISDSQTKTDPNVEDSESNEAYYTESTFKLLVTQTDMVRELINDKISEQDVTDFIKIIVDAMNGLEVVTKVIDDQIYSANGLNPDYITASSYATVVAAKADAQAVLDSGELQDESYNVKFAAVEEMKLKAQALKDAIDSVNVNLEAYRAFIASKEPLLDKPYDKEGIESLRAAIAEAKAAPDYVVSDDEHEAFGYFVAMSHIEAILAEEEALVPDISDLLQYIEDKTAEMNERHTAPEEDEEGNIIPETVDPEYIGIDMVTYEYYTAESYATFLTAINDAQSIIEHPSNFSIEDVQAELVSLQLAYSNLEINKKLLKDLIEDCQTLDPKYYEEDSYTALMAVVDECVEYCEGDNNSITDYVATYKKLNDAKSKLVFDTSALNQLIEEATNLLDHSNLPDDDANKHYYSSGSLQKLTEALQEAYAFDPAGDSEDGETSEEASEMAYRAVCNMLRGAIDGLVNIEPLKDKIAEAKTYKNDDNAYNQDAFDTLQTAIANGTVVYETANVTKSDVAQAIAEIDAAIKDLTLDGSSLEELLAQAKAIVASSEAEEDTKYFTKNSLDALKEQIEATEDYLASDNKTPELQAQVKDALYDAISGVIEITELKEKIAAAHQFVEDNPNNGTWTATSYTSLLEAISVAEEVYAKDDATSEEVATQVKLLSDLQSYLVEDDTSADDYMFKLIDGNETLKLINADGEEQENHDIENPAYLINLALDDTLSDILTQFTNTEVKAFKADGETEITDFDETKVATGIILRSYHNGEAVDEIILVVRGDLNGDGKISAADKAQMNGYFNGTKEFEGAYLLACDINGDAKISAADKAWFNGYFNGTKDLYEGLSVKVG